MIAAPKDRKYESWRWRIFGVTWLAYAGLYLTRKAFSVAKIELQKPEVLGLTKGQMSAMDGAYSAAYAFGQFFWGAFGDRFGTRKIILVGMMASILTAIGMGLSTAVVAMGILFTAQGFWQASGWAPLSKNMGNFFSRKERGSVMGLWCTNYALGGFVATIIAGFAANALGWRGAFWMSALLLLFIWIIFFALQRDRPEDVGLPSIEEYHGEKEAATAAGESSESPNWQAVGMALRNGMVWYLAGVYFLVKPTRYLLLFWSPVYISERLGSDAATSGILASMFDLAGPIGTLLGGVLSDKVFGSRRMPICIISLFILSILMMIFPFIPVSRAGMALGMFVMGFLIFIPDSLIAGAAAIDFGTKRGASTANGLINGFGSIGQMIGVSLPGLLASALGASGNIWPPIFVGLGISLAAAALMLAPMWNRVPKESA